MTTPGPRRARASADADTRGGGHSVGEAYVARGRRVNRAGRTLAALGVALWVALAPGTAGATTLVVLGDSLVAGYELAPGAAFPDRLGAALGARGHDVEVVNAGASGDTSAGGLARLDWALGEDADAVIVELGANDALRGLAPAQTRDNLDAILTRLAERGIPVLLAGMLAPRNLGSEYAREFDSIYPALADAHDAVFYPFFLEGVATDPDLNLADGMHPNAAGVEVIVGAIVPAVEELLARAGAAGATAD